MPELPEVETVRRILLPQLESRVITGLTVYNAQVIAYPGAAAFAAAVKGGSVSGLRRRGKYLLIDLNCQCTITVHLRMTGQLLVTPGNYPMSKHTHVVFPLDNGEELRFIDVRRFGRVWLLDTTEPDTVTGIHKLGLEPFAPELTADYLREKLGKRRVTAKQALLDQSVIAGIGNIYADEILHQTGIHPQQKVAELGREQWEALCKWIPPVLNNAIESKCLSPEEYLRTGGREYRTEQVLRVYGREGKCCLGCGALIERVVIAGRSSHYCPVCQKK